MKDLVGCYIAVHKNEQGESLYPAPKGLIVKVSNANTPDEILTIQMRDDSMWKIPTSYTNNEEVLNESLKKFMRDFIRQANYLRESYWGDEEGNGIISIEGINRQIEMIKKHALVSDVYITKAGRLVVITKNLTALDYDLDKTNTKIGEMAIKSNFDSNKDDGYFLARNQTYIGRNEQIGFYHPHVDSGTGICLGECQDDLYASICRMDLYSSVSVLIEMFTQFDMEDSEYTDWMGSRRRILIKPKRFLETKAKI